jgi:PAS domain S-box-containing protein
LKHSVADRTVIWARDTIWPVRDGEGRLLYTDGSLEDITARKQEERSGSRPNV